MGPIPVIDVSPLFTFPPDREQIQGVSQAIGDACKGAFQEWVGVQAYYSDA